MTEKPMRLTYERREKTDLETGRKWIQLTSGDEYCYPIYYFEPSVTADGRTVIFYRYRDDEVQNWKLDIDTGEATQLTAASMPNCLWRSWGEPKEAFGVGEQMSAFCPASEEMTYFDDNVLHAVNVQTLEDRVIFNVPDDRVPRCIPGLSPDGKHLVFAHVDREWWEKAIHPGPVLRHEAKRCYLDVVDMATGECRNLLAMNTWLTHANFYDNNRIIFANLPTEGSILLTDLRGGWYASLRPQTADRVIVNHYVATARGIQYETVSPLPNGIIGYADPDTFLSTDFPTSHPIHHIGHDWEGRLLFGDIYEVEDPYPRHLAWLPKVKQNEVSPFTMLTGGFTMYGRHHGECQRSHIHASLMPDRKHILFTGPDEESETNHIFLLDVSDLAETPTLIDAD